MKKTLFLLFFCCVTPLFGTDNYLVVDPFSIEPTRWRDYPDQIILIINGIGYCSVPESFMELVDQKITDAKHQGHHLQIWEENVLKNPDNGLLIFSEELLQKHFQMYFADAGTDIDFTFITVNSGKEIKIRTSLNRKIKGRSRLGDVPISYKKLPNTWREGLKDIKRLDNVQYFKFALQPLQNPIKYEGLPRDKVIVGVH